MPFHKDFIINNSTKVMTWNIVSGELDESHLNEYDKNLLKKRSEEKSREYFLAVRKLLNIENPEINIYYDKNGKPYLNNNKGISISHSNELVGIGLSNEKDFGIDIQIKTDKVFNIQNKFLSKNELLKLEGNNNLESLTKIWSAKESIYKSLGKKGVNFSSDLEIDISPKNNVFKTGHYINRNNKIKFDLIFFSIDEYIICYAKKS